MGEAEIFKEYLKGEIENFEEFKRVKLDNMLANLYPWVCVDHIFL